MFRIKVLKDMRSYRSTMYVWYWGSYLLKINIEKLLFQTNKHVCKPTDITEEPEKISVKARKSKENTLTDAS